MSATETATGHALRRRRWLLYGLTASLALNGFLIGAIIFGMFAGAPQRRGMVFMETRAIGENLPREERRALRASLREMMPELRQNWRRLRQLRHEINEIAAAPEPDRAAIDVRLVEIREITSGMQAAVQARVFDEVLALPPEMRARLAPEAD